MPGIGSNVTGLYILLDIKVRSATPRSPNAMTLSLQYKDLLGKADKKLEKEHSFPALASKAEKAKSDLESQLAGKEKTRGELRVSSLSTARKVLKIRIPIILICGISPRRSETLSTHCVI